MSSSPSLKRERSSSNTQISGTSVDYSSMNFVNTMMDASLPSTENSRSTLTILGCGALGTSILSGLVSATDQNYRRGSSWAPPRHGMEIESAPPGAPTRFIACVRRAETAPSVLRPLSPHIIGSKVEVLVGDNLRGLQQASVVILTCQPSMMRPILEAPGVSAALQGKLLISMLGGVSVAQIEAVLYSDTGVPSEREKRCYIVRAISNIAANICSSMTIVSEYSTPMPPDLLAMAEYVLGCLGEVRHILPGQIAIGTALSGSGLAFFALFLEAMVDGAVSMGLPRADSLLLGAHTMRGAAEMVLNGEHPAAIREKVTTPAGCTMQGLQVLEESSTRGIISNALRTTALAANKKH